MKMLTAIWQHLWLLGTLRHDGRGLPAKRGTGLVVITAISLSISCVRTLVMSTMPIELFVIYAVMVALTVWVASSSFDPRRISLVLLAFVIVDVFAVIVFLLLDIDAGLVLSVFGALTLLCAWRNLSAAEG